MRQCLGDAPPERIREPDADEASGRLPDYPSVAILLDERVFMSLGILKIAASIEARGGSVEVLDLSGYANFIAAVADHARRTRVRHFGITATTPQLPAAVETSEAIRATRPDARLILGGPHVTLTHAALKRDRHRGIVGRAGRAWEWLEAHFDVLVAGDGEERSSSHVRRTHQRSSTPTTATRPISSIARDWKGRRIRRGIWSMSIATNTRSTASRPYRSSPN